MIDEAHELKKQSMVILAVLKNLIKRKKNNIRLIITSATLNTKLFEEYFKDVSYKVIEAVTPTFDVEVHYTKFPDLETNLLQNTVAHLRVILEVALQLSSAHQEELYRQISEAKHPCILAVCQGNQGHP